MGIPTSPRVLGRGRDEGVPSKQGLSCAGHFICFVSRISLHKSLRKGLLKQMKSLRVRKVK